MIDGDKIKIPTNYFFNAIPFYERLLRDPFPLKIPDVANLTDLQIIRLYYEPELERNRVERAKMGAHQRGGGASTQADLPYRREDKVQQMKSEGNQVFVTEPKDLEQKKIKFYAMGQDFKIPQEKLDKAWEEHRRKSGY